MFSLVVDDFGVKYVGTENAQHLVDAITESYGTTIDWAGTLYCGITLKWDYVRRTCELSIPNYVINVKCPPHLPAPKTQPTGPCTIKMEPPRIQPNRTVH
jgi:hypothetical protein